MEEIKINDYIRTKYGEIEKVVSIDKYEKNYYLTDVNGYKEERDIVKHSPNIIDLIEEGDYVKILADEEPLKFEVDKIDVKHKLKNIANDIQIKFIITKEQMESIKYEV